MVYLYEKVVKNELGEETTDIVDEDGINFEFNKDILIEKITKFLYENFIEWQDTTNKKYEFSKFKSEDSNILVEYLVYENSDPIATLVETVVSKDFISLLDENFNPLNLYLLGLLESSFLDELISNKPVYVVKK